MSHYPLGQQRDREKYSCIQESLYMGLLELLHSWATPKVIFDYDGDRKTFLEILDKGVAFSWLSRLLSDRCRFEDEH